MFEAAELGRKLAKKDYDETVPELRAQLLAAQEKLKAAGFPVILVLTGDDNAGRTDTVNALNEWMDARYIQVNAFDHPSDEELERPEYWRYWRALPPKGRIGLFYGSWYSTVIHGRLAKTMDDAAWQTAILRINGFERGLTDDGALLIKVWIHLGKEQLKKRVKALKKDPETAWRVSERDVETYRNYDRGQKICERLLFKTSTGAAPWTVVEGVDGRYRDVTVARILLELLTKRLDEVTAQKAAPAIDRRPTKSTTPSEPKDKVTLRNSVLGGLDLSQKSEEKAYKTELARLQGQIARLHHQAVAEGRSWLLVFEGWDAAGKGSTIRRLIRPMDSRFYKVVPIAAPTEEERAQHYLWRFWRHLPRAGHTLIFDRSWYGRVLVERIEGFIKESAWMRAYAEINDFEEQLVDSGMLLLKFWLHIDKDEQLRRFKERETISWKKYKITEEDYRNRDKWDQYVQSVDDMVQRTSTDYAPWLMIPANDKKFGRLKVLSEIVKRAKKAPKGTRPA